MTDITRKPRAGLFFIGTKRYASIGEGTPHGTYIERLNRQVCSFKQDLESIADVTFPGIIYSAADVKNAISSFIGANVDYVLVTYLSWAEDHQWIRFLRDMPACPILFCHKLPNMEKLTNTNDESEFCEFACNNGLVGILEASGSIKRFNRKMVSVYTGTWAQIVQRAEVFGRAALARALLRESRIGLLASMNELMWSTYVDPYSVFKDIGPEVNYLSLAELEDTIGSVQETEARAVMAKIAERYEIMPDVDNGKFLASVRTSIGLERLAEAHEIDLLVFNDVDPVLFKHIGLRPGFWPTNPNVHTLCVPEGDIGAGIACYTLKILSGKQVNLIEPFFIDTENDTFAGGHAGPNDYTDSSGKCIIANDVRFAKTQYKYAGAPFAWYVFPEGRKTMLHCSEQTGKFQFVVTQVETLPTQHFLATFSHGVFRPVNAKSTELFQRLAEKGVTQHYGIAEGNYVPAIKDVADMLDFDCQEI